MMTHLTTLSCSSLKHHRNIKYDSIFTEYRVKNKKKFTEDQILKLLKSPKLDDWSAGLPASCNGLEYIVALSTIHHSMISSFMKSRHYFQKCCELSGDIVAMHCFI